MKSSHWAIDSLPIGTDIQDSWDYSGLQVYGLKNLSLGQAISEKLINFEQDKAGLKTKLILKSNLQWSDGSKITGFDYFRGIQKSLNSNRFLANTLFRNIEKINVFSESLEFKMKKPNFKLNSTLQIPNFSPIAGGDKPLSSGNYRFIKRNSKSFIFRKNKNCPNSYLPEHVKIVLVKNPNENIKRYKKEELDITADTSFHYKNKSQYENEYFKKNTGLLFFITFGTNLSKPEEIGCRAKILKIINQLRDNLCKNITYGIGKCSQPLIHEDCHDENISFNNPLVLTYDDYYPNREVAEFIAFELNQAKIPVQLIKDDFYFPKTSYDLKLKISRGPSGKAYTRYASFSGLGPIFSNKKTYYEYITCLDHWEQDPNLLHQKYHINSLRSILAKTVAMIPLFEIPGIYFSRTGIDNPLLQNLINTESTEL